MSFLLIQLVLLDFVVAEVSAPSGTSSRAQQGSYYSVAEFPQQRSESLRLSEAYEFVVPSSGDFRRYCVGQDQYFTADGELGLKGRILKREFASARGARSTSMKHLYFRNDFPGMAEICPRFQYFNDDEKLNFWIWYMAAIAHTESDCGRNAYNPTDPNGISAGELQIPENYNERWWRGITGQGDRGQAIRAGGCWATGDRVVPPSYTHNQRPALLLAQLDNNLSCGVEILSGVLCGFYTATIGRCEHETQAPWGHGFWARLRGGSRALRGTIVSDVKEMPLCHH